MTPRSSPPRSPGPAPRRRLLLAGLFVALAGCSALVPRSVDVPVERIQEAVAQQFPIVRRVGDAMEVSVDTPQLSMLAAENRIAVDVTMSAVLGSRPARTGNVTLSGGLFFEAASNSVRARDVRIERLRVDGLSPAVQRVVEPMLRPVMAGWLEDRPVYTLRPRDIERLRAANVVPGAIRVTAAGIVIDLEPRSPGA